MRRNGSTDKESSDHHIAANQTLTSVFAFSIIIDMYCKEIIHHLNCLITSKITSSSIYKFITSIPIDFSFRLKYS
jgi:hypothetical protein